jgi:hypothetical protein
MVGEELPSLARGHSSLRLLFWMWFGLASIFCVPSRCLSVPLSPALSLNSSTYHCDRPISRLLHCVHTKHLLQSTLRSSGLTGCATE